MGGAADANNIYVLNVSEQFLARLFK